MPVSICKASESMALFYRIMCLLNVCLSHLLQTLVNMSMTPPLMPSLMLYKVRRGTGLCFVGLCLQTHACY